MKQWCKKAVALVLSLVLVYGACPLTLTATAATISPIEEENFTILWATDPQWYSFAYPEIIANQNNWVVDNYHRMDMRYIVHTGDFVDNPNSHEQWAIMDAEYKKWDDAGLAYGILAGNHDVSGSDHSNFSSYFGESRYNTKPWYGGSYQDNFGHYDLMTIEGVDFIFVYMGYNSSYADADFAWMNSVLAQYPNRIAFLSFHDYLYANGQRSANGEQFFQRVVLKNPNVRQVMCGHNYNSTRKIDEIDDDGDGKADRTVYQMMANYQSTTKGGNGFMRFMEFDLSDSTVIHRTYSPYTETFGSDYETGVLMDEYGYRDSFTVPFDFSAPVAKKAGDPEFGSVVVSPKVSFAATDADPIAMFDLTYQNTAITDNAFRGVGIYDRYFSLDAADAAQSTDDLMFVSARYTSMDGYTVTRVTDGAAVSASDPVAIPHDGVVIVLPKNAVDVNGKTVNMTNMTVGRKVVIHKADGIASPSSSAVTLSSSVGEMYHISGTNRVMGTNDWVLYDAQYGASTAAKGLDHEWDMLFAFEPDWINYRIVNVDATLGKAKDMTIPTDGFVLAVNTYAVGDAARDSLRRFFTSGKTLTLNGHIPGKKTTYFETSLMPSMASGWSYDSTVAGVYKENDAYVMYNTDGLWPSVDYTLPQSVTFDPAKTKLRYDLTIETNAKANILLFFKNSNTTSNTSGEYLSIQSYFDDVIISTNSGDMKGDDLPHSGEIDLSTVAFPDGCYNADGTLTLNAVRILVSGTANTKRYFRDFSLVADERPILPPSASGWSYDSTVAGVYEENGAHVMYNTDGLWPSMDYDLPTPITFDPAKTALAYDFTIETNAKANIILFFKNSNTTSSTSGEYLSIQSYFPDVIISTNSGDAKGDDLPHSGKVSLSNVAFPEGCYNTDGTLTLNGIRIMVSGTANTKRYFRNLALTDVANDETPAQAVPLMDPDGLTVDDATADGGYVYNDGKLTVTSRSDSGYGVTVALNKAVAVDQLQNWLLKATATTRFDINLDVTTAAADANYGLSSDLYPLLCEATDNDMIPAGSYQASMNLYNCYTYNQVAPADGMSTIKKVHILLGGKGELTIDLLALSNAATFGRFADGVQKSDGYEKPKTVFETTYPLVDDLLMVKAEKTLVSAFLDNITSDYTVTVTDVNGAVVDNAAAVKTGDTVTVSENGTVLVSYVVVVCGDVDGDGVLDTWDVRLVLLNCLRAVDVDGVYATAADYNQDGKINTTDARRMLDVLAA